jgi:chromosome segregation ATPase
MSEERINLERLGARVLTLTAEVRDLRHRFTAMESRFSALESRFTAMEARLSGIEGRLGVLEDRMSLMLLLIVRIAERARRGKSMIHEGSPSAFAAATIG